LFWCGYSIDENYETNRRKEMKCPWPGCQTNVKPIEYKYKGNYIITYCYECRKMLGLENSNAGGKK
jgi:hypothetical protein